MFFFGRILVLASVVAFASCATALPLDQAAPTVASAKPATGQDGAVSQTDAAGTEDDDTQWRFEAVEDGEPLKADDFDAWMEHKDVQVATGEAAGSTEEHCPSAEHGDGDGEDKDCAPKD